MFSFIGRLLIVWFGFDIFLRICLVFGFVGSILLFALGLLLLWGSVGFICLVLIIARPISILFFVSRVSPACFGFV